MIRGQSSVVAATVLSFICLVYLFLPNHAIEQYRYFTTPNPKSVDSIWAGRVEFNPVTEFQALPMDTPAAFPPIQAPPNKNESPEAREIRASRLNAVKEAFRHSWRGYRDHAWLADEVTPVSGHARNTFGGWAATLIDSLDTLWIMDLKEEFHEAVLAAATIDFERSVSESIIVFETTIRYLGGMLSAYELSGEPILLQKAEQLGHMLYAAFDTPSRMPMRFLKWEQVLNGSAQEAPGGAISADVGSLGLEFTKLSELTGNPKFYDAIQRVADVFAEQQDTTELPGMWPVFINTRDKDFFTGTTFTLGGMADSLYEYLPKMHILLGGQRAEYRQMYEKAIETAKQHLFFRPMNPKNEDILISGTVRTSEGRVRTLDPEGQHLSCFVGGMVGMSAKLFHREEDLEVARKITDGCFWAYESMPHGIMPETFIAVPCNTKERCKWDEGTWHLFRSANVAGDPKDPAIAARVNRLPPGFGQVTDARYILRPEAIESIFYMYRITGDTIWQDKAWKMFTAIDQATKAPHGYSAIRDVLLEDLTKVDSMESFWTAETLKYLYLLFSNTDLINLDEWVLNTEAHPLRRMYPKSNKWW